MKAIYIKPEMEIVQLNTSELLEGDEWGKYGVSNQKQTHSGGNTGFFDDEPDDEKKDSFYD